jgi:multiple sugar transport system ATP-binding protein
MPQIQLKNITKRFGKSVAVDKLNLVIGDGDFVTLLGPSGCGKTTTLRMIAGLETPTEGEIYIDGRLVFSSEKGVDIAPDKRDVGFLFQNYALWPHMTVYQNIAFGLENLKWPKDKIRARVSELLAMLKIAPFEKRYPSELSGGQQQRVAIARTLATGPKVLLLDEPLSNLDAKLRTEMRAELKRLHMETDSTFVYVTHDQLEAMTLSTAICLMKEGLLQQYEPPMKVYASPSNAFVADFVPFYLVFNWTGDVAVARSAALTTIVLFELLLALQVRSDDRHFFQQGWKALTGNKLLFGALAASLLLQLAVVYFPPLQEIFSVAPLTLEQLLLCVVTAMSAFLIVPRLLIRQVNGKK